MKDSRPRRQRAPPVALEVRRNGDQPIHHGQNSNSTNTLAQGLQPGPNNSMRVRSPQALSAHLNANSNYKNQSNHDQGQAALFNACVSQFQDAVSNLTTAAARDISSAFKAQTTQSQTDEVYPGNEAPLTTISPGGTGGINNNSHSLNIVNNNSNSGPSLTVPGSHLALFQVDVLRAEQACLKMDLQRLTSEVQELRPLKVEVNQKQLEIKELNDKIQHREQEILLLEEKMASSAKHNSENVLEIRRECEGLREKNRDLKDRNINLEERNNDLVQQVQRLSQLHEGQLQVIQALNKDKLNLIEQTNEEKAVQKSKLLEQQDEITTLHQQLSQKAQDLENKNVQLLVEINAVQKGEQWAIERRQNVEEELQSLEQKHIILMERINGMERGEEKIRKECEERISFIELERQKDLEKFEVELEKQVKKFMMESECQKQSQNENSTKQNKNQMSTNSRITAKVNELIESAGIMRSQVKSTSNSNLSESYYQSESRPGWSNFSVQRRDWWEKKSGVPQSPRVDQEQDLIDDNDIEMAPIEVLKTRKTTSLLNEEKNNDLISKIGNGDLKLVSNFLDDQQQNCHWLDKQLNENHNDTDLTNLNDLNDSKESESKDPPKAKLKSILDPPSPYTLDGLTLERESELNDFSIIKKLDEDIEKLGQYGKKLAVGMEKEFNQLGEKDIKESNIDIE